MRKLSLRNKHNRGFTVFELVVVILIVGFLSSMALSFFINLKRPAAESATKGGLGAIRSAITINHASSFIANGEGRLPTVEELRSGNMFMGGEVPYNKIVNGKGILLTNRPPGTCRDLLVPLIPVTRGPLSTPFKSFLRAIGFAPRQVRMPLPQESVSDIQPGWMYHQENGRIWALTDDCQKTDTLNW